MIIYKYDLSKLQTLQKQNKQKSVLFRYYEFSFDLTKGQTSGRPDQLTIIFNYPVMSALLWGPAAIERTINMVRIIPLIKSSPLIILDEKEWNDKRTDIYPSHNSISH